MDTSPEPGTVLPEPLTAFIGREREVDDVLKLVSHHRLVTITGAGGSGKSRLALEVARRFAEAAPHAVRWVELAPLGRGELLSQHVAAQLRVHERPDRILQDSIFEALRPPVRLLVIDNCEHVIDESARFVTAVLRHCQNISVLCTSRESLGIDGERSWLLRGLSVDSAVTGDDTSGSEAVQLFADRARSVYKDFELTPANAAAIRHICIRLDGLPLAIELAAARTGVLALEQISARLDDVFGLLTNGSRSALPRQRTLRATVDWSFKLISAEEQDLLLCLSIFAGTFSLESAEHVCSNDARPPDRVLDLLAGLVARSMVRMHEEGGSARYSLLEIIRQYANELLSADSARHHALRRRHAAHYAGFAVDQLPSLERHPSPAAVERISIEYDNLRAALHWSFGEGERAIGHKLAGALWRFWGQTWQLSEAEHWWKKALEGPQPEEGRDWGQVLNGAGSFIYVSGNLDQGRELLGRAAEVLGRSGDLVHQSMALGTMAHLCATQRNLDAALDCAERAAALARQVPETWPLCHVMSSGLALVHRRMGRHDLAEACLAEALTKSRQGEPSPWGLAAVTRASAELAADRGNFHTAREHAVIAIVAVRSLLDPHLATRVLLLAEQVLQGTAQFAGAAEASGAIDAAKSSGMLLLLEEAQAHRERIDALRRVLGEDEYARCAARGAARTVDQALAAAVEVMDAAQITPASRATAASDAIASPAQELTVRALGTIEIEGREASRLVEGPGHARCRELFIYLLIHPEGQTRDQIGLEFWPEASAVQVKNNFHVLLHKLRKALGHAEIIIASGPLYRINPAMRVWFDVAECEREIPASLRKSGSSDAFTRLEAALALYRGRFMFGTSEADWILAYRDRLQMLQAKGLSALADLQIKRADRDGAIGTLERLVRVDELHEPSWRRLMTCLAESGRRDEALMHYLRLIRRLRDELDVDPEPATQALARKLKSLPIG